MSAGESFTLASNAGEATGFAQVVMGGTYYLAVEGTLGSASYLQVKHASGNWANFGAAVTADIAVSVPPGQVRFVTGSGATAVYAYFTRITSS